ncbi:MAG: NAD(P)H-dependent oxidoreductase [Candidatus Obscuribacterales bacterium]|nr:NAD(P)H-dependent oxidoreductase [Candidatus Obscuribacterales bacterium]
METMLNNVVDSLKWRYATKKFDCKRKIDDATWNQIEEALILTPSSFGLQPWKFIVITDQSVKDQLPPLSWNQNQPADCSHYVVLCRLENMTVDHVKAFVEHTAKTRSIPVDSLAAYGKMMTDFISAKSEAELNDWMARQCYIALGNLMTAASMYGVDNCPMEGIDQAAYDKLLRLPEKGCRSLMSCALGYRAADDKYANAAKVRFAKADTLIHI